MTDGPTPRMPLKDVIALGCALVGAIAVVGGMIRSDGGRTVKIEENSRRIAVIEGEMEFVRQIDRRTIRIESKLEMMSPSPKVASR